MAWYTKDEIEFIDGLGTHTVSLDQKREGVTPSHSTQHKIMLLERYLNIAESRTTNGNWLLVDGPKVEAYIRNKIAQLRGH